MDNVRHCTFSARLDCRYLLRVPDSITDETLLVAALHGFGQDPETILRLSEKMLGPHTAIAAIQGPNEFFLDRNGEVGYCWNTNRHASSAIRLHHDMVLHVLNEAGREYAVPPERRLLLGFSQPVALNYRFAATCPDAVRGVIGICGGVPGDWETAPYQQVNAAVLHIARREDEYYPPAVTEHYAARLRTRTRDVEYHLLEGGHRFPSAGGPIVERWLARVFPPEQLRTGPDTRLKKG